MSVSVVVGQLNFPSVYAAFVMLECDSGGHLIGTVYPGEKKDLTEFEVPEEYAMLLPNAERALKGLISTDFETFVIGDYDSRRELLSSHAQGNLADADELLNAFFFDWEPDKEGEEDPIEEVEPRREGLTVAEKALLLFVCGSAAMMTATAIYATWVMPR